MIAIVKYNAGNVRSVGNALARLGVEAQLTDNPAELASAEKVIFPGVGEAASGMRYLKEKGLDQTLRQLSQPFLGICLGMQLMCSHSEEGDTPCMDFFPEQVRHFPADRRIPHMGWNSLRDLKGPLFEGIPEGEGFYFVHSYYAALGADTIATTDYMLPFSAALHKDNFYAVQFHPEKSAKAGSRLLHNFLSL